MLEDFEGAGIWVAEGHFAAKDTIFAPGDPDQYIGTKAQQPYAAV